MVKPASIFLLCISFFSAASAQDAASYYAQANEKARGGQYEEAIALFSKTIELQEINYLAWYNRGIAKMKLGRDEAALPDFDQAIKLSPAYQKAYLNRGTARKHLKDYSGAIHDYTIALKLDSKYADALYQRGTVYELISKRDSACADYKLASELGLDNARVKLNKCGDTTIQSGNIHSINNLTITAGNAAYGFTKEKPILVGTGPNGGPANQRAYLDLLRDAKGKPVTYKRLGSCCPYPSENGFLGSAMLDRYEITYLNEKGREKKTVLYLSFYDYEEPQIVAGFFAPLKKEK